MEGIVAGVPRLAHYDVDIDAGSDASTPEDAVSFSLTTPQGETLKQPGNLFFLTETALYGTNPDLQAKGTKPDVNGDGKVEFGEGLPDADIYKATLDEFLAQAKSLDEDAQEFEPTASDALTSIVVMTPTMSEYFEAWKNSRFIAGEDAEELGFVATSRLSDIADILGGILVTYDGIEPTIAKENPQQAKQTRQELESLVDFASDLRDREAERREVQRQAGRRARRPGAGPGRGDRRPGDAGRQAARSRTAGRLGVSGGRRNPRRPRGGPALRRPPPAPSLPGRPRTRSAPSSSRRRRSCSSARGRAARSMRAEARLLGRCAPALPRHAGAELGEIEASLAAARRAAAQLDEAALAAARGRIGRGPAAGRLCGRGSGGAAAARRPRRAPGCRSATSARPPVSPAPGSMQPPRSTISPTARSSPRDAVVQIEKDLLDTFQARLVTNLDEAAQAAERGFDGRLAETAAIARGYWLAIAPEYEEQQGADRAPLHRRGLRPPRRRRRCGRTELLSSPPAGESKPTSKALPQRPSPRRSRSTALPS